MTSTTTSSSYIQLRTRLLHNEALHQRWGDSPAINISLMAVAIVVVLFCLLANNIMIPSDLNNDNDNNDTDSNSNPNANNAADNSSDAVNHKMNPEEEEERKKNIIFKLFRSEHIVEEVRTKQASKRESYHILTYSFKINYYERSLYYHTN